MVVRTHNPRFNRSLLSIKVVIFFVISGLTALHVLHATKPLTLGLKFEYYRYVSIVAPFISIIGPLIAGPLADRLAAKNANFFGLNLRILTAVCLLLSALVYSFLFLLSPVIIEETGTPAVSFGCDANGAFIYQARCFENASCSHFSPKSGSLKLTNCTYTCQDTVQFENMYTLWFENVPTPAPSTEHSIEWDYDDDSNAGVTESLRAEYGGEQLSAEEHVGHRVKRVEHSGKQQRPQQLQQREPPSNTYVEPPHLCTTEKNDQGENVVKNCHVYTHDTHHIVVHAVMHGATNNDSETQSNDWCNHPLDNFQCQIPATRAKRRNGNECRPRVQCDVIDSFNSKDSLLRDNNCLNITGNLDATQTGYMAIRFIGDIFPMAVLTLLNTAIVIAVRDTSEGRGEVCRQYVWGAIGYVLLFSPLELAFFNKDSVRIAELVALIIVIVSFVIGACVLLLSSQMPLSPPEWWWHTKTGVLVYPMSAVRRYGPETILVTVVAILFGTFWSSIHSYLLWTFYDPYAKTFAAIIFVLVFFFNVDKLIEYCGHSNIFIAGFAVFIIRFTALDMQKDCPGLNIFMEIIEPAIIGILWLTVILYMRHVVPRKFTATGQGLAVISFFGIGKGLGALIGLARDDFTGNHSEDFHQYLAMVACIIAVIYFLVYNLMLAPRCAAKSQHADDLRKGPPSHTFVGTNGTTTESAGLAPGHTNDATGNYSPLRVYHNERGKKGQFRY